MKSYVEHLKSRQQYGVSVDPHYKPVFRSSAIFPILHGPTITSEVLFLGYWLLKRQIKEVTVLLSLRDGQGALLERRSLTVDCVKAFKLTVTELLPDTWEGTHLEGSLELEVFSSRDMVFPYPAFVVSYVGEGFSTAVHTTGRIYNNLEDLQEHSRRVGETGFDIHAGEQLQPFIAFVNGVAPSKAPTLHYTIINHLEQSKTGSFQLADLGAYQTAFVRLDEYIPQLAAFLDGKAGTIKLEHHFEGFFPRFVAGNFQQNPDLVSITHTYYDCSSCALPEDYWTYDHGDHHESCVMIPLFYKDDLYTQLVLYPIFSPSSYQLDLEFFDENGQLLHTLNHYGNTHFDTNQLHTIDMGTVLQEQGWLGAGIASARIIARWTDHIMPTRLKLGLNVGSHNKEASLPCNICFAPKIGDPRIDNKTSTFKWSPVLNQERSVLIFQNSPTHPGAFRDATIHLQLFRELDEEYLERTVTLSSYGQLTIDWADDQEWSDFLQGQSGWVTAKADNPYVIGWYFDFGTTGAVAGDHSF